MASPILKPLALIPLNCYAEILEAINKAPLVHKVSEPYAKK
jgi:hypothetical protein